METTVAQTGPDLVIEAAPMVESRPDDAAELLQERYDTHGYLLVRQALDPAAVAGLRHDILTILNDVGWLAPDQPVHAGIIDHHQFAQVPDEVVGHKGVVVGEEVYGRIYRLESFHQLAHESGVVNLCRALFGGDVFVHPRTIARVMVPSPRVAPTPSHQDFIHVQGSRRCVTSWIPLGDCPRDLGSLTILSGSHRGGVLAHHQAMGAGELEAQLCQAGHGWHEADLAAGDLLLFTSLTVHRALPNRTGDQIRLSVDYRYQPAEDPVDAGSLAPHVGVANWDEVYADWPADSPLRYFWTDQPPEVSPWDAQLKWQPEQIC